MNKPREIKKKIEELELEKDKLDSQISALEDELEQETRFDTSDVDQYFDMPGEPND